MSATGNFHKIFIFIWHFQQGDDQIDGIGLEENIQNLAGDDLDNKHGLQYYPSEFHICLNIFSSFSS